MGHQLDGCVAKLDRADVQIRALERSRDSFLQGDTYTGRIDHDPQAPEPILRGYIHRRPGAITMDRAALRWGAVVGETIHDLRSALDSLVWRLTEREQGSAPSPISGRWKQIAFPIVTDPTRWPPVPDSLWGISPGLCTDFKKLQPFRTGKDAPEREPLAVLHELWNIDKHRHIHVARRVIGLKAARLVPRDPLPDADAIDPAELEELSITSQIDGVFEDGAELGRIVYAARAKLPLDKMYVEADVTADIAFDQGPPANGAYVVDALKRMSQTCRVIVEHFRPEFGP